MRQAALPALFVAFASVGVAACSTLGARTDVRPISSSTEMLGSVDLEGALQKGREQMRAGRYGLALTQFRNAAVLDPSSAAAQNGLAVAYTAIGRQDLAQRYFARAIELAPQNLAYRRNYARLNDMLGQDAKTRLAEAKAPAPRLVTAIVDTPVQGAVIALRTSGEGRPRLEALAKQQGPRLAVSHDDKAPIRLVTRSAEENKPASRAAFQKDARATVNMANATPVWRIVTNRAPASTAQGDRQEQGMIERTSASTVRIQTQVASGADAVLQTSALENDACRSRPTLSAAPVIAGVGQLSTRIITCRS
mgnify:CR=1 FL=1|tara:strand:- start:12 stop:935 length:924 start_codon:yes stop_codon:yes gene_type:complete